MIENKYFDIAVKWLNSKRDFDEGIQILRDARFRPGVVNKLQKDKQRVDAMDRLVVNMNALVSAFCTKDASPILVDTDPEIHVFEGKEDTTTIEPQAEKGILSHENDEGNIGLMVKRYTDLYRQRDRAFKQLKQVGENNDEQSCILRKQLSEQIEKNTDEMEQIYPYYQRYSETGEQPSDEELGTAVKGPQHEVATPISASGSSTDLSSLSRDDLTKLQYNIAKRITRTRNKLTYQSENKLEEENPLPQGPRRIKLEKKLASLEQELERVKIKIAELA